MVGTEDDYNELHTYFEDKAGVRFYKKYSEEAVHRFYDGSLDLVYLDAEHTYDGLYGDINLWWPKIKKGGILAGHDIFAPEHVGVTNALTDIFACPHKILSGSSYYSSFWQRPIFIIPHEICPFLDYSINPSWYVIK
jgi:hypothetical protein